MEVILIEKLHRVGSIGDVVNVKNGFARNYLIPTGKAIVATKKNKTVFEERRAVIELENEQKKEKAELLALQINGKSFTIIKQAGEDGKLYGSVSSRDIASLVSKTFPEVTMDCHNILLASKIKEIGSHTVKIALHPDVIVSIGVVIARTEGEASANIAAEALKLKKEEADSKNEI